MTDLLDRPELDTRLAWALFQAGRLDRATARDLLGAARSRRPDGGPTLARSLAERGVLAREELQTVLHSLATAPHPTSGESSGPRRLGDYELLEELGSGGMGVVYVARHVHTGRRHALKTLHLDDAEALTRFQREGEGQARVDVHPNVVRVHTLDRQGGTCYLVMDLASGGSLEDRLAREPPTPEEATVWVRDLARAVEHAHRHGVLHRDLKPQNVLFEGDTPQLVDFGLAKLHDARSLTTSGTVLGTPAYMAPEQVDTTRGEVGPAADVYGLGAILYRCLTGRPPVQGSSSMAALLEVLEGQPPPPRQLRPEVPPSLEAVCLRALAKDPAARYPSAAALAEALEEARRRPDGSARGRGARLGALVGVALGGGVAVLAAGWLARSSPEGAGASGSAEVAGSGSERRPDAERREASDRDPGSGSASRDDRPPGDGAAPDASPPDVRSAPEPRTRPPEAWSRQDPELEQRYQEARAAWGEGDVDGACEILRGVVQSGRPCNPVRKSYTLLGRLLLDGDEWRADEAFDLIRWATLAGEADGAVRFAKFQLDGRSFVFNTPERLLVRDELTAACVCLADSWPGLHNESDLVVVKGSLESRGVEIPSDPAEAYRTLWEEWAEELGFR